MVKPLVTLMNIPENWQQSLYALVKDFVVDKKWSIPNCLHIHFPNIVDSIHQIHIPTEDCEDRIVWDRSMNGKLSFKESFLFLNHACTFAPKFKLIWSKAIPPARSFLVWRIYIIRCQQMKT